MEYETYETEQTYDDMNGHELDKTKVWILTGCHNLHNIFKMLAQRAYFEIFATKVRKP